MIYWGARQIMIEVGALEPGDVIEYEIAKKGFTYALLDSPDGDESRFIPPMRGQFYDIVPFWCYYPTVRKVYAVSLPMEKEVQFQFYQGECASSMRYEDGRKVYKFAVDEVMPFKIEPDMVDFYDAAPKLMMSTTHDWREKSLWFNKVNEDYGSFEAYAPAQKKVDELIRGKETEMEKIAVLTHWVADNIRYSGISMGKGEGYTLHNTEMNYTDRCGVCKDIAGTLISFLRMAGFEAYPAMTMAGSRVESIPADHFNHCVAVVKLSDGTYSRWTLLGCRFCRELWSSARTAAELSSRGTRGIGSVCYSGLRPREPLCEDRCRQRPVGRRYSQRDIYNYCRRTERLEYPPHIHYRLPERMAQYHGAAASQCFSEGASGQCGLRKESEGLPGCPDQDNIQV